MSGSPALAFLYVDVNTCVALNTRGDDVASEVLTDRGA